MREITIKLYSFDELSDEAKEVARDWWRSEEDRDPAWLHEHNQSAKEAMKFIESYRMWDGVSALKAAAEKMKGECPWTGYCADAEAIDAIIEACEENDDISDIQQIVRETMNERWEEEYEAAMEDENVDENIRMNDYEFLESGHIR